MGAHALYIIKIFIPFMVWVWSARFVKVSLLLSIPSASLCRFVWCPSGCHILCVVLWVDGSVVQPTEQTGPGSGMRGCSVLIKCCLWFEMISPICTSLLLSIRVSRCGWTIVAVSHLVHNSQRDA